MLTPVSDTSEKTDRQKELVKRTAYWACFLRAGGTFGPAEWRGMLTAEDRDALEAAGEQVAGERALAVARCIVDLLRGSDGDPLEAAARLGLREVRG